DPVAEALAIALELADEAEERLAGVDRIEDQRLAASELGDQRQLFGTRAGVAAADVAVDDVDVAILDVDAAHVGADATDGGDEVVAIVADVDAGDLDVALAPAE